MAENIINKNEIYEGGNPFDELTKGLADFLKILKESKTELKAFSEIRITNLKELTNKDTLTGADYKTMNESVKELNKIKEQATNINKLYNEKEKEYNELFAERQKQDNIYVKSLKEKEKALHDQQKAYESLEKQRSAAYQKQFADQQRLEKAQKEEIELRNKQNLTLKEQSKLLGILRNDYRNLTDAELTNLDSSKKLLAQINALDSNLKKHDAAIGNYQRNVGNYGMVWGKVNSILAGVGITLGAQGIINFGKEVTQVMAKFEKFEAVLSTTLGDKSKAKKYLQEIAEFAAQTPFQVDELTDAFVKLANRGIELQIPQFKKLGDVAAALGKPFAQLNEAILDISSSERWKELGIKSEQAGDKIKLSFKGQTEIVEKTEKGVIKALEIFGSKGGVIGQMEAISRTTSGQLSNLSDNFNLLLNNIGKQSKGVINSFVGLMSQATGALKEFFAPKESQVIKNEIEDVNTLVISLQANINNIEKRNELINELQTKYPEYFKNLGKEGDLYFQVNDQLKQYNLLREMDLKRTSYDEIRTEKQQNIVDLKQKENKLGQELIRYQRDYEVGFWGQLQNFFGGTEAKLEAVRFQIKAAKEDLLKFTNTILLTAPKALTNIPNVFKEKELTDDQKKAAEKYRDDQLKAWDEYFKKLTELQKDFISLGKDERKKEIELEKIDYTIRLNEYRQFIEEQKKYLPQSAIKELKDKEFVLEKIHQQKIIDINKKYDEKRLNDEYELNKLIFELNEESQTELLKLQLRYEERKLEFISTSSPEYTKALLNIQKIEKDIQKQTYDYKNNLITIEYEKKKQIAYVEIRDKKDLQKELLSIELQAYEARLKLAEDFLTNEAIKTGNQTVILDAIANVRKLQRQVAEAKKDIRFLNAEFGDTDWFAKIFNIDSESLDKFNEGWDLMKDKVSESINAMIQSYQELSQAEVDSAEKAVESSQQRIDSLNNELTNQIELQKAGLANNADKINNEIQQEKQRKARLEAERNEAIKNKIATDKAILIGDSIIQASNLITATTKIWNVTASILPPLGQIIAVGAIATMWGSFIAQKNMMMSAIEAQKPKFAKGEVDINGKLHSQGGIQAEIEGGESVINRQGTRINKTALQLANKGINLENHYLNLAISKGLQADKIIINKDETIIKKHDEQIKLLRRNNEILQKNKTVIGNKIIDFEGNEIIYS